MTPMPNAFDLLDAWRALPEAKRGAVLAHLRTLSEATATQTPARPIGGQAHEEPTYG